MNETQPGDRLTNDRFTSDRFTGARAIPVVDQGERFAKELDRVRARGSVVGLVPTMGALHDGHAALVRRAAAECDAVAVTIFVNPLQFDSAHDLATYPADLDADVAVAAAAGATLVFAPSAAHMWPGGRPSTTVHVEGVSSGLEGASRPGHFDGVATVVARLFNLAGPARAYFGEKDFQQLAVVRNLVHDLAFPVEIVGCPTVREPDGLAMSSRNVRLAGEDRWAATVLYRALMAAQAGFAAGVADADGLRAVMAGVVATEPRATLDYAEVVDPLTMIPLAMTPLAGPAAPDSRLVVAAEVGGVRLIDNCPVGREAGGGATGGGAAGGSPQGNGDR